MSLHDTRLAGRTTAPTAGSPSPLAGRRVLLVGGRCAESDGPGVNALAVHLERIAGPVAILPVGGLLADLVGRCVIGRPDLVVAILPGRGASLSAVRVAARLGTPLLVLFTSDAQPSWGEVGTLRRATRVAVTSPRLCARVKLARVPDSRIELWPALLPSALTSFEGIAARTLRAATGSGMGAR
jgi:hypothetical protein